MTQSTTCPVCKATMWRGSLHVCHYRREVLRPDWRLPRSLPWCGKPLALVALLAAFLGALLAVVL